MPSSSGESGLMTVTGGVVASDDDLTLWATQLPTGTNFGPANLTDAVSVTFE
ncbi:MAG: hypothetical protein GY711_16135 [bacterium]|nr:hypothetical protein [bacterium]